jgi:hypothetical protein
MKILLFLAFAGIVCAQTKGYQPLFNGKDLTGWETRGDGKWIVIDGGVLVGQRDFDSKSLAPGKRFTTEKEYSQWLNHQAWLYTKDSFEQYDLHLEFWTKEHGTSGISLHDPTRAAAAMPFISPPPEVAIAPSAFSPCDSDARFNRMADKAGSKPNMSAATPARLISAVAFSADAASSKANDPWVS